MRYQSTRGGVNDLAFEDVLLSGYACDDGLYLPTTIPLLSPDTLESWRDLPYTDIVKKICAIYIEDEVPADVINEIIDRAFKSFPDPKEPIKSVKFDEILLMEMFHGKSLAFKDLSMCCTALFMEYFLKKRNTRVTILIGTSGSTGASALAAFSGLQNVDVVVILPKGRITKVQELTMTTVVADNCYVIRLDGTSDDVDTPVRKVFSNADFVQSHYLANLNSVNWCRMMVQIAHHFYCYFQGRRLGDVQKNTVVYIPTGGLGNATSACIAYKMGLPIQVVCAVTNNTLLRVYEEHLFSVSDVYVSLASAINTQVPYNWERMLCLMSDMDTDLVSRSMTEYNEYGKTRVPDHVMEKVKRFLTITMVTDAEILNEIKTCHEDYGYKLCPQTAAAMAAVRSRALKCNHVVLGVASPLKFQGVVEKAGVDCKDMNLLEKFESKQKRYTDWDKDDDWTDKLKQLILQITSKRSSQ